MRLYDKNDRILSDFEVLLDTAAFIYTKSVFLFATVYRQRLEGTAAPIVEIMKTTMPMCSRLVPAQVF